VIRDRRNFYELLWILFQRDPYRLANLWAAYRQTVDRRVGRVPGAMRVLICVGEPGCAWFRCIPQALELSEDPRFDVRVTTRPTREDFAWTDWVWLQRVKEPVALQAIERAIGMRKRTIYEVDDDFEHVPPSNPTHDYVQNGPAGVVRDALGMADIAAFSTAPLADVYEAERKVIWPNVVDPDMWPQLDGPRIDGLVFGFSGSPTHNEDLATVGWVIAELMAKYENVWFVHSGVWVGTIQLLVPHERVLQFGMDMGPAYLSRYTRMFDIGIAPLVDNAFNRSKSGLRLLEHSWCDVPTVASDLPPYSDTGIPCRLASTQEEWWRYLEELVVSSEARSELASASRGVVRDHWLISQNIWRWKDVILE